MELRTEHNIKTHRSKRLVVCFNFETREAWYTVEIRGPGIYDHVQTQDFAWACKVYDELFNVNNSTI